MMERLARGALALGISLNIRQLEQFESYYRMLVEWNRSVNLTRITSYEDVQLKHFLDSLTVASVLPADLRQGKMIDIGTGAGFPGLPLKIAFPDIKMALMEATAKKTAFLMEAVSKLMFPDVSVINGRAEEIGHQASHREQYDVALARAVAELASLAELALPLCKVGGCFIAQKKGEFQEEITRAAFAISTLGGELEKIEKVVLSDFEDERFLVVIRKVLPTPEKYPRRSGMPVKRPLGRGVK